MPFTITGSRFGSNKIVKKIGDSSFLVRCNCGAERQVVKSDLSTPCPGCGCHPGDGQLYSRPTSLKDIICRFEGSANRRGIRWFLTDEQANQILVRPCHYCGNHSAVVLGEKVDVS